MRMATMPRLDVGHEKYAAKQSPLFRLRSKRKLAELLGWSGTGNELDAFANRADNYRIFTIHEDGKKPREVQEPKEGLQRIHRRLASLLLRIAPPDYLHSGLRNRSFVTNGACHVNAMPAIKLDIKKFYPSTKWAHIFRCFREDFECAEDVAGVLASLTCVSTAQGKHLPTGSAASQILAYYVHRPMFDAINQIALERKGVFTLYVDDMVLSLPDASPADIRRIGRLITGQGLGWHKDRFFPAGTPKRITGTIASPDHLLANKRQHFKYLLTLEAMDEAEVGAEKASAASRGIGLLFSIAQVDPRYMTRARKMAQKLLPISHAR